MRHVHQLAVIFIVIAGSLGCRSAGAAARHSASESASAPRIASQQGALASGDPQPLQEDGNGLRVYLPLLARDHVLAQTSASTPSPTPVAQPTPTGATEDVAPAQGPRLFKSGPIQITADGHWLWVADAHANSISRIDTITGRSTSFPTSNEPAGDNLKGLSVMEDGSAVWAAAHDTDRVYVHEGASGARSALIQLPWGCGPYGIALSPPVDDRQHWALVSCIRSESLIAIDTITLEQTLISPVFRSPFGIAWADARSVWVTHLQPDDLNPRITGVSFGEGPPKVTTHLWFAAASPRDSRKLTDPVAERNLAEGGYVTLRGHPARFPGEKNQLWIPTQYQNVEPMFVRESYGPQPDGSNSDAGRSKSRAPAGFHSLNADVFSPDSGIQASVRRFDLETHRLSVDDKVVLTAAQVHDPTKGEQNPPWIGYGWDASVSGLVDIGFSRIEDRLFTLLLAEQSDELVLMPSDAAPFKSRTDRDAPGLPELRLGHRPTGMVAHPSLALVYAYNSLGFDISEVDIGDPERPRERRRIAVAGAAPWSPVASAPARDGAKLFYSSADPRISINEKVSCASCHVNGEHDGRTWAFQALPVGTSGQGHGMRGVHSLLGLGDTFASGQRDSMFGWGQLHRSGDRDEIQDFEYTFRSPLMGGTGFLGDAAQAELGPSNAGLDPDLDNMANYLMQVEALARSPYRNADGALSEAAVRGAASFLGADTSTRPADANCASCHVPETAFLDHAFHDIGLRRDRLEEELNDGGQRGACLWCVNTSSLVGVWDTAPYDGIAGWGNNKTLREVIDDFGTTGRLAAHGAVAQLSGSQRADLESFVGSIDGDLRADELRGLRDRVPPRIARVSVTSLTRLEVWFSEAVDEASASDPSHWRVVRLSDQQTIPISRTAWDGQNEDRVSLYLQLATSESYRLEVRGDILDLADQVSGGSSNALDQASAINQPIFEVGELLTITLGASGYENLTIPVHDASPVGPNPATWSHDHTRLIFEDGIQVPGFVRFDWQETMRAEAGLIDVDQLVAASFSLHAWAGDAQVVELRRVLQSWSDPAPGRTPHHDPVGGPTWRDHSHPDGPWNLPGAGSLGSRGDRVQDYDANWDLAAAPDLSTSAPWTNAPVHFQGDKITDAFRFWLAHPEQDYGYALSLAVGKVRPFLIFRGWEEVQQADGPVLTLRYQP